jgi:hypothetical protein
LTALARGKPPAIRSSMSSPALSPGTAAAAESLLADGVGRHLVKMVHHVFEHVARLVEHAHAPGRVAGIVKGDDLVVIAAGVQFQLAVLDQIGGKLGDVNHLGGAGVLEDGAGDGVDRVSRKSAGPFMVSMYWLITRHMWPHSPPRIHLTPRRLASMYIFELSRFMVSWEVKKPKLPPSEA